MNHKYKKTVYACFVGYTVQAIVNNFLPLLFLTIQSQYGIPLSKITFLITFNFAVQLGIDLLSAKFVDKIGYRSSALLAHGCAAAGLLLLIFLPDLCPDPFVGILIAVVLYAVGGGLLEVIINPIIESCPSDNKEAAMSLLHSFYCWGHVGVVLISTLFFRMVGIENWKYLAGFWVLVPVINGIAFAKVPMVSVTEEGGRGRSLKELMSDRVFWLMMLLMLCAGACEQAVSQWASTFAEAALNVSKTIGDLTGPMMFAVCMGISRTFFGKYGEKLDLIRFMKISGILCLFSYLMISLSPMPVLSLIGCGLCGLAVGILWPGTCSLGAARIRGGGTKMFAFFALAGDVGCTLGPTYVGNMTEIFHGNMKMGILWACIFPVLLLFGLFSVRKVVARK